MRMESKVKKCETGAGGGGLFENGKETLPLRSNILPLFTDLFLFAFYPNDAGAPQMSDPTTP